MARKKDITIAFRVTPAEEKMLDALCKYFDLSRSDMLRKAMQYMHASYIKPDKNAKDIKHVIKEFESSMRTLVMNKETAPEIKQAFLERDMIFVRPSYLKSEQFKKDIAAYLKEYIEKEGQEEAKKKKPKPTGDG